MDFRELKQQSIWIKAFRKKRSKTIGRLYANMGRLRQELGCQIVPLAFLFHAVFPQYLNFFVSFVRFIVEISYFCSRDS